ncbi:PREDICTED: zinc finger MYM-type protein 1-like [Amphimedon queenslandica]|uniref:TTF-type domain-containing protein n=1 Tax=Amphimedon queenslandica TaxID=400682 RepID=A0A1X7VKT0_AMPQE|nr:PREDICTED: zinc finger MYM-type protein 1-like [Amphimedon queenslandica]|eukprot:XP_011410008.1 PREDICTED: zinc finger MYM-type protein 1-like [Amphimedon queenslandica]
MEQLEHISATDEESTCSISVAAPTTCDNSVPDSHQSLATGLVSNGVPHIASNGEEKPFQLVNFSFPTTSIGGKERSFNPSWYRQHPWLEYSVSRNAVFCFACHFFSANPEDKFVKTGYCDRKHATGKTGALAKHNVSEKHQEAMANWSALTVQPHTSVASLLDRNRSELIHNNRHYIKVVIKVVLFCALREISVRGHREGESASNKGNFLELMELFSSNDETLKAQLHAHPRNATYFSILADETRDVSKQEQMSFVIRYVSVSNHSIQERFLTFVHATGLDASSLTQYIKDTLALYDLNPLCIVSQSYDGASVMSGRCREVQTRVREFAPHAVYIHCHGHIFNLVLIDSIKSINRAAEFFALLQVLCLYFFFKSPRSFYSNAKAATSK